MWIQNGLACNTSHEKVKCVTPKVNLMNIFLVSTYVVCERLSVMHKQVSGWTVNFCPNSPESPFLEFQTRKPPPPQWKTSDFRWPKFTPEYPPQMKNFRFQMTKVYSGIPPPALESGRSYVETNLYPQWIPLVYAGDETRKQGSTLDLKPRADFTKSLKQEYQKGFMSPQILF